MRTPAAVLVAVGVGVMVVAGGLILAALWFGWPP